jgi:hypothetical protein
VKEIALVALSLLKEKIDQEIGHEVQTEGIIIIIIITTTITEVIEIVEIALVVLLKEKIDLEARKQEKSLKEKGPITKDQADKNKGQDRRDSVPKKNLSMKAKCRGEKKTKNRRQSMKRIKRSLIFKLQDC